jgi:hypothetical protein
MSKAGGLAGEQLAFEELAMKFLPIQLQVLSDIGKDCAQGANFKLFVDGNREVMFHARNDGTQTDVAPGLPQDFVPETFQKAGEIITAKISRKLQAGITSSLTQCKRITEGLDSPSK